jgi:NAD(P)-dependent dehydrogenase (short-subunit alcohol dehydrogenase family)
MTVLVAGGTGALGEAVVSDLHDAGWACAATWMVARERERLTSLPVDLIEADLLDADAAQAAVDAVDELEAVVNLVGGFGMGPKVHDVDPEEFDRLLRLNLMPAFNLARAAMPSLIKRSGAFVGVGAKAALEPFGGAAGYITGKAALLAFVKVLDAEYRKEGVRCNAILPSVIDTPANRESMPNADWSTWVPPAEIAKVIRFLVSEESRPTSGALIPVYGRA